MKDLAIFGAEPMFRTPLHVGRPNIAQRSGLLHALGEVLDSGWLTNDGPWVRRLEERIERWLGVKHCVAVANGTLGLEIAARVLMPRLGEVIVPSFTFIATPHALAWQGYKPVFADIDAETHTLDPRDVEAKITSHTRGILGVHTWGTPCEIEALETIARKYDLELFFDAAHAFGCQYRGRSIGNFGSCEVFSFHATKFFNTVEGGAVVTNEDALADLLRMTRNFGFPGDGSHRVGGLGINAKMSELHAAVGMGNLSEIQTFIGRNLENYSHYRYNLDHPALRLYLPKGENSQYVVVELMSDRISADSLARILRAEHVFARRYFSPPCHKLPPYSHDIRNLSVTLPVTEAVSGRTLVLPTGVAVDKQAIDQICELIIHCIEHAQEIQGKATWPSIFALADGNHSIQDTKLS